MKNKFQMGKKNRTREIVSNLKYDERNIIAIIFILAVLFYIWIISNKSPIISLS